MHTSAPSPTRHGTYWHLPARKPTIAAACRLLALKRPPATREVLRHRMAGWRSGANGEPWGADVGSLEEWQAVQRAHDAYVWLQAQLPAGQVAS